MFNKCDELIDWISHQRMEQIEVLKNIVRLNSGSKNQDGIIKVAQVFQREMECLVDSSEEITTQPIKYFDRDGKNIKETLSPVWKLTKRPKAPMQVLLTGHLDTVFPADSPFQTFEWLDDNTLRGPGVTDMKGGLIVMLYALRALELSPLASKIGWQVLLNGDEEIGSLASREHLIKAAEGKQLGLVYEPSLDERGTLASSRKGIGKYSLHVLGRAAHAGRDFSKGQNAIVGLSQLVTQVDALNGQREGVTINVGNIIGGTTPNVVAEHAMAHLDVRISQASDEAWIRKSLSQLVVNHNESFATQATWQGTLTRPCKPLTEDTLKALALLKHTGKSLDIPIDWQATGGCCDGNILQAAGLTTLDSMGVRGGKIHTDQEYIMIPSLVERTKLSALFLLNFVEKHVRC